MLLRATLATLEHEVCPVCGLDVNLRGQTTGQPSPTGAQEKVRAFAENEKYEGVMG